MSDTIAHAVTFGPFDDMRSSDVRFLQEAARRGPLEVFLWSDALVQARTGRAPKFPQAERQYYLEAIRFVQSVHVVDTPEEIAPARDAAVWLVPEQDDTPANRALCDRHGLSYHVVTPDQLAGLGETDGVDAATPSTGRKVLVTGCYDWFHTGHIRFFEECSELGHLYVVVGHDANIRLLKGEGHPMFSQDERRYLVQSIRYVTQALISSGDGWMDAEPEIAEVKPDMYAVNEDGDKPVKRQFCADHGLEYVVLKRLPKPGLPRRESTHLRGF